MHEFNLLFLLVCVAIQIVILKNQEVFLEIVLLISKVYETIIFNFDVRRDFSKYHLSLIESVAYSWFRSGH